MKNICMICGTQNNDFKEVNLDGSSKTQHLCWGCWCDSNTIYWCQSCEQYHDGRENDIFQHVDNFTPEEEFFGFNGWVCSDSVYRDPELYSILYKNGDVKMGKSKDYPDYQHLFSGTLRPCLCFIESHFGGETSVTFLWSNQGSGEYHISDSRPDCVSSIIWTGTYEQCQERLELEQEVDRIYTR